MKSPMPLAFASLFFLGSGASALIYQICWQRLFVVFAGGDLPAITVIVAAFMLGLGLGSSLGGRMADHQTQLRNVISFVLVELAIAAWGVGSEWLYHDLLYQKLGTLARARVTSHVVLFLMLLPPTIMMGFSLPLLAKALTPSLKQAPANIGLLYGLNTLGAAAGAFITPWCLVPLWGISGALQIAAALNGICAFGIAPLIWLKRKERTDDLQNVDVEQAAHQPDPVRDSNWRLCLILHGVTGFIALGLEMIWFRVLGVLLKSTAFTFGTLLSLYLLGLGLGALLGARFIHLWKDPLKAFLRMQAALVAMAVLSMAAFLYLVHHVSSLAELLTYLDSYEPLDANTAIAQLLNPSLDRNGFPAPGLLPILHLLVPAILMLPSTILMGMAFPALQKAAQTSRTHLGQRIGDLQAANIAGAVLGSLLVGCVLLAWLGTTGTLRFLVLLAFALAMLSLPPKQRFRAAGVVCTAVGLFVIQVLPSQHAFWAAVHGSSASKITQVEDSTGVTVLKKTGPDAGHDGDTVVYVNGIGQSWLPYGGIHTALGALPALLHPKPENIAVIGLGSGDTAYSAGTRYETREIVCVEIIGGQLEALRRHHELHPSPSLQMLLQDSRIRHVHADGRRFLIGTKQRFDIIEADALRPNSAGSGILYSEEYFQLLRRRLKPGGYAVTWLPTERVRRTFLKVFPHVLDLGAIAIGSPDPITANATDLRRRMGYLEVRQHFRLAGVKIHELLAPYVQLNFNRHLVSPDFQRDSLRDLNTDLLPRDEFHLPALWPSADLPMEPGNDVRAGTNPSLTADRS